VALSAAEQKAVEHAPEGVSRHTDVGHRHHRLPSEKQQSARIEGADADRECEGQGLGGFAVRVKLGMTALHRIRRKATETDGAISIIVSWCVDPREVLNIFFLDKGYVIPGFIYRRIESSQLLQSTARRHTRRL